MSQAIRVWAVSCKQGAAAVVMSVKAIQQHGHSQSDHDSNNAQVCRCRLCLFEYDWLGCTKTRITGTHVSEMVFKSLTSEMSWRICWVTFEVLFKLCTWPVKVVDISNKKSGCLSTYEAQFEHRYTVSLTAYSSLQCRVSVPNTVGYGWYARAKYARYTTKLLLFLLKENLVSVLIGWSFWE